MLRKRVTVFEIQKEVGKMFLTETDLINAKITADSNINESEILKYIIKEDRMSDRKKRMIEGEKYYSYEHDIENIDFSQS